MSESCQETELGTFDDPYWYRDKKLWLKGYAEFGTVHEMARHSGASPRVISEWRARHGISPLTPGPKSVKGNTQQGKKADQPGVVMKGDTAVVTSEPSFEPSDIDRMLRERGINPDDWEIERVLVNEWDTLVGRDEEGDAIISKLRQLKVFLRRKVALTWLFPATEVAKRYVPKQSKSRRKHPLVVVCGDQQAPYHEPALHEAFLRWLADVQPQKAITCGDTADFPTISKYRDKPRWSASVQDCLDTAYKLLSDYRDASPDTVWQKLRGNHDARMENELLTRAERMFGVKPAEIPGQDQGAHALSLRRLLHLDALGIELVGDEEDDWTFAETRPAPGLVVKHRPPKQVTRLHASVMAGDSHRQSVKFETGYREGQPQIHALVEVGTLARIREGLGYALEPNWQQGFATCTVGPKGELGFDLAVWRDNHLIWRGESW